MLTFFELLGRVFAASLESVFVTSTPASIIAIAGMAGAIGLVAAVAAAGITSVAALAASLRIRARLERPIEPADKSATLSQSDPDADGRPRPRAPGLALPTA